MSWYHVAKSHHVSTAIEMLEVSVALTLAVLSLLLVMKYDRSGES